MEDESRSKTKSKEVEMEWKEKSITETVETEMKDHQVRNLEPGLANHGWTREEGGGS